MKDKPKSADASESLCGCGRLANHHGRCFFRRAQEKPPAESKPRKFRGYNVLASNLEDENKALRSKLRNKARVEVKSGPSLNEVRDKLVAKVAAAEIDIARFKSEIEAIDTALRLLVEVGKEIMLPQLMA